MITAIDTNILLDVLLPNEEFFVRLFRRWKIQRPAGAYISGLSDWRLRPAAASRLLSRDRGFYRKLFPKLSLLDPSST
jgi:hypothetical protein